MLIEIKELYYRSKHLKFKFFWNIFKRMNHIKCLISSFFKIAQFDLINKIAIHFGTYLFIN